MATGLSPAIVSEVIALVSDLANEEGLIRTATMQGRGRLPVRADKPR
jgi:hypothetical protein